MSEFTNKLANDLLVSLPKTFPAIVWRNNRVDAIVRVGGSKRKVSAGVDGQADITGIVGPNGRRLEIEVKGPGDRMSVNQTAFSAMIEKYGGIYVLARDVEGCLASIREKLK